MRTLSENRETVDMYVSFLKVEQSIFKCSAVWFCSTRTILTGSSIFLTGTALYFQRFEKNTFRLFIYIGMFWRDAVSALIFYFLQGEMPVI